MALYQALEFGTLSNPYRTLSKGDKVELTEVEVKLYAKSKWLVPAKRAREIEANPVPLTSAFREGGHKGNSPMALIHALPKVPPESDYQTHIDRLVAHERSHNETGTAETEGGSGDKDVLG